MLKKPLLCRVLIPACLLVGLAAPSTGLAADYFLESDDYRDGEEVVGKFLVDSDYAIMVEEIERNGQSFDWGWVKTPGYSEQVAEPIAATPVRKRTLLTRKPRSGGRTIQEPRQLAFDLKSYKSVYVAPVGVFFGLKDPVLTESTRESFKQAMDTLGLKPVESAEAADLELGLAIVDLKAERTYAYVAMIDPFIELELKLVDRATGERLVLLRNQAHSGTPTDAARRFATLLVGFLQ